MRWTGCWRAMLHTFRSNLHQRPNLGLNLTQNRKQLQRLSLSRKISSDLLDGSDCNALLNRKGLQPGIRRDRVTTFCTKNQMYRIRTSWGSVLGVTFMHNRAFHDQAGCV